MSASMASARRDTIVNSMTEPSTSLLTVERKMSRRRLSTDVTVMASMATVAAGIVQWPILLAADRAVHLFERLRRHPDGSAHRIL